MTALPLFRFPGPPAEPAVRLSTQRALHEVDAGSRGDREVVGVGDAVASIPVALDAYLGGIEEDRCRGGDGVPAAVGAAEPSFHPFPAPAVLLALPAATWWAVRVGN